MLTLGRDEAGAVVTIEFVPAFCKLPANSSGFLTLFEAFTSRSSALERRRGADFCTLLAFSFGTSGLERRRGTDFSTFTKLFFSVVIASDLEALTFLGTEIFGALADKCETGVVLFPAFVTSFSDAFGNELRE